MTRTHITSLALIALVAAAATAGAQQTARVDVAPNSKVWIDGTSTLHEWSCTANSLNAEIDFDAAAAAQVAVAPPKALKKVDVKIPVKALHCSHGGMDGRVYDALKADKAPEISYILATFEPAAGASSDSYTLKTVGKLTIAGKTNSIDMDVQATRMPDGTIKATGKVPVKMSDYGVQPPTALFGRIKAGDVVTVNFELTVGSKAIAAALEQK